ncbi:MAG: ABC transporter substrate-binding protein [Chloroflexota bacterium]
MLWTLLVLVVLIGSLVLWLRAEPAQVTQCEAGFVLFEDASGADCIPENVTEVLSLSPMTNQLYLALGIPLAVRIDFFEELVHGNIPGLVERLDEVNAGVIEIELAGSAIGPNLERFAQADPQVIISEAPSVEINKALGLIAPVIYLDPTATWKENMVYASELVGEREAAEALVASYAERLEILRAQFEDPAAITVSAVRLHPERDTIQMPSSFAGQIIRDAGFSYPEEQVLLSEQTPDQIQVEISEERIDVIDADHLFLFGGTPDEMFEEMGTSSNLLVDEFRSDPLFQFLNVAETGNVHIVGLYWRVPGIYSAHAIIDDLFRQVAGVDPDEVSPNPLKLE